MAPSFQTQVDRQQCAYCGKVIPTSAKHCPYCREMVAEVRVARRRSSDGRREIRRGLLYMLLSGVIYYFAAGYSTMTLPLAVNPVLVGYLAQFLFLGAAGLSLYGLYLRMTD